ncbi:sulfatase [Nonomuraea sp. NBC_00507]|uniref:sulfatase family protein n=1 Tax=Nonomuraea sp. NBC_00507 TaxID=2976002 RepID=UPI002E1999A5
MERPPDVVLIHCHDLGRFLSCYGAPAIPSPSLHALAERSVVFDNAFATAPLCTPARSSLFTGLSPHVNGLMGLAHAGWRYRRSVATMPELMSGLGYDTALIGLQHEHPNPMVLGFDEVHGAGFLPRAWPVARETEAWLRNRRERSRPFLLTVGMWEVHRPWPAEDYTHADPAAVEVPPYLPDNAHTREDLAAFYGAIRQLDAAVGHVIDAIDRHCDPDRTAVVFTTDHGAALPRAKGTLYDPGVEVALIVRPPAAWGVPPGRRGQAVSHLDILPTLLEMAGGSAGPGHEGRSIVPDLRGAAGPRDRTLFLEKSFHDRYDPMRAVRTSKYKYIRNFTDGPALVLAKDIEESPSRRGFGDGHLAPRPPVELYDLRKDPWEQLNIAAEPAMAETVASLDDRLLRWMRETGDPLLDGPIPVPPRASRLIDAQDDLPGRSDRSGTPHSM